MFFCYWGGLQRIRINGGVCTGTTSSSGRCQQDRHTGHFCLSLTQFNYGTWWTTPYHLWSAALTTYQGRHHSICFSCIWRCAERYESTQWERSDFVSHLWVSCERWVEIAAKVFDICSKHQFKVDFTMASAEEQESSCPRYSLSAHCATILSTLLVRSSGGVPNFRCCYIVACRERDMIRSAVGDKGGE